MTRYAVITLTWERDNPEPYMPANYRVVTIVPYSEDDRHPAWRTALIAGEDNAGWTLDEYVLPRLASGGMYGHEIAPEDITRANLAFFGVRS